METKIKNIPMLINRTEDQYEDLFKDKINLEVLKKIWNDENGFLTPEEIIRIREWLYAMAAVIIKVSTTMENKTPIISIKEKENYEKESDIICKGEYRRAS